MFSHRTRWQLEDNPLTRAVRARRSAGLPVLDLTASNPTRVGLPLPEAEIAAALADPRGFAYEPEPFGLADARAAVAAYHQGAVPAGQVVLTASTSEAYGFLFKLLCEPGDRILVPAPSYPLFEFLAGLESVQVDVYPSRYADGWHVDVAALQGAVTERTRAVLLVSPNNPTGAVARPDERAALAEVCRQHGLALVVDEVFADYPTDPQGERCPSLAGHADCLTFVLSGLSKVCLLPQLKLGWMAVSGPPALVEGALQRLEVIADTYLSLATPVQWALPRLLALGPTLRAPVLERLRANRAALQQACRHTALSLLDADGGWSAVVRVPRTRSDEAWALALLAGPGVLVHPGFFFDFASEGHLVLSLLPPEPTFAEGIRALAALVGQDGDP